MSNREHTLRRAILLVSVAVAFVVVAFVPAMAKDQPNILVIWGDDIGQSNISAYTKGMMGYRAPHIDRIAREGIIFTDYYGEQSCTAGRVSCTTPPTTARTTTPGPTPALRPSVVRRTSTGRVVGACAGLPLHALSQGGNALFRKIAKFVNV